MLDSNCLSDLLGNSDLRHRLFFCAAVLLCCAFTCRASTFMKASDRTRNGLRESCAVSGGDDDHERAKKAYDVNAPANY